MPEERIYFGGSIRGGRADAAVYAELVQHLKTKGKVLTEHVGSTIMGTAGEIRLNDKEIHDRDMFWLVSSGPTILEVTQPSLGVGYEIARAIEHGKKVLCLFRQDPENKLSAMVNGSPYVSVRSYSTLQEAVAHIDSYLNQGDFNIPMLPMEMPHLREVVQRGGIRKHIEPMFARFVGLDDKKQETL